jgi:hypothetical protein
MATVNEKALYAAASRHMDAVRALFSRPDDVRITLLVRTPWLVDGGVLLSDDDIETAIAELRRLNDKPVCVAAPREHEEGGRG